MDHSKLKYSNEEKCAAATYHSPRMAGRKDGATPPVDKCDWVHFAEHPSVRRFPSGSADSAQSPWIALDIRWTRALSTALSGRVPVRPQSLCRGARCGVPVIR